VGVDVGAKSLRRVNGRVQVTDDPLNHGGETVGCVFVVEASDIADAVRVASLHPTRQIPAGEQLGWRIKVRPVHTYELRNVNA